MYVLLLISVDLVPNFSTRRRRGKKTLETPSTSAVIFGKSNRSMPGLKKVLKPHHALNSSTSSESSGGARWNWSQFIQKRKAVSQKQLSNGEANMLQGSIPQSSPSNSSIGKER